MNQPGNSQSQRKFVAKVCPLTLRMCFFLTIMSNGEGLATADNAETEARNRTPWTTSRIVGCPEPPLPYVTEAAYPSIKFNRCLDVTNAPGTDRLFVVEQNGKILSFPMRANASKADLVANFAKDVAGVKQVYALAFHPNFKVNRYCYICYIKEADQEDGTHVARFTMSETDPPTIDVATEETVITWRSGGHNGCCLKFGPDGCLYISTGDAGPANPPDPRKTGQDISDLLSSILRIDVDQTDGNQNYVIPDDNPFVNREGARGEVWAYGLRNPWRMSFDRESGDLWVGDVGWELWEMLYRIERGGNYGWAVMEGRASTHPEWPRGPTPVLPPTIDHRHSESSSITEGLTYSGKRLKELKGTHIYGDYDTGKIWGFRFKNRKVVDHRELADTTHRIVGFGEGHEGELLILDHTAGTIHRLAPNPRHGQLSNFPTQLSETGLYESVKDLTPNPGVVPYSIVAEPWADHAISSRLVGVPGALSIKAEGEAWKFPENSVLVKTLSLEMTHGDPATRRRIETQILHFDGTEWMPYTYRWNDGQTDAVLVEAAGAESEFEIKDRNAIGGIRKQQWRFSGRAECQRCHNKWSGPVLGFDALQLNKPHDYGDTSASHLDAFTSTKLIEKLVDIPASPKLVDPYSNSADINDRARAYLHTNCAHCHRLHAGGAVLSHMHCDLPLEKTNMVAARPSQGTFGIHSAKVIAPGDPYRSVLMYRMAKLGSGRMPRIGSTEVDAAGLRLIHDWLKQLPEESTEEKTSKEVVKRLQERELAAVSQLSKAKTEEARARTVDRLLSSPSSALRVLFWMESKDQASTSSESIIRKASNHSNPAVRDLFERFLPAEERIARLGTAVDRQQILSMTGDATNGKQVFFATNGGSCKNCHSVAKVGKELGPDLTQIGKKLDRGQILESILEPSRKIDPRFVMYLAETINGRILTGLLVERNDKNVVLMDGQGTVHKIPTTDIEQLVPQRQSLMPDLLVRDLTAQQLADLLAWLSSLK